MNPKIAIGEPLEGSERIRWHDLAFAIERSRCYYLLRQQWFQRWALIVPGFSLLAGSIGVTDALGTGASGARLVAIGLAAVLAIIAVLVRLNHRAFEYQGLLEKTKFIEAKMIKGPPTGELLQALEEERALITYGPERGVLNAICHNKVVQSWGYGAKYIRPVTWWQNLLKQFLTEYRDPTLQDKPPGSTVSGVS